MSGLYSLEALTGCGPARGLVLAVLAFALTTSVGVAAQEKAHGSADHAAWTYGGERGPEHWAELESGAACDGDAQSPINIIAVETAPDSSDNWPLVIDYPPATRIHDVVNNGHSIQYDFDRGDTINFRGDSYALVQVHFHEPSEHTINGLRYPIEMHLVHYSEARDEYTVLAVMGEEGRDSAAFTFLEAYLPVAPGEEKVIDRPFSLRSALPPVLEPRFHYRGSLTTPPCSENVNWVVFRNPVTLSHEQVVQLQALMPLNNYRGTQERGARVVSQVVH
jgi:carbonic anhydrase